MVASVMLVIKVIAAQRSRINRGMKIKRDATKAALRFHTRWLSFLLKATPQTLRRVAHELALLEEENRNYRDGAIFRLLRHETEFVVQNVGGNSWTVARSRRDFRGRTRHDRQRRRVQIDHRLQSELRNRLRPSFEQEGSGDHL
jgi:hypothetical protein